MFSAVSYHVLLGVLAVPVSLSPWERTELGPIEDLIRKGIWYNCSGSHMLQFCLQTQGILAVHKCECILGSQKTCGYFSVQTFIGLFVGFFSQHQISMIFLFAIASLLINLAHCLAEMVLKLWDWQISLWLWPEWLIMWSGHLLRVGSFSWLMEMGQPGGRSSWEGTRYWFGNPLTYMS